MKKEMNGPTSAQEKHSATRMFTPVRAGLLQRKCACGQHTIAGGECTACRQKRVTLQRRAINQTEPTSVPPIVHEVLRSPGQPLDPATRSFMEPRFGHDFSRVRVHTDARAAESARAVNALAYTVGRDIVLGVRQYAPGTTTGRKLLAHELAHVVQQVGIGGTKVSALCVGEAGSPHEREADRVSQQVVSGSVPGARVLPALSAPAGLLQRESALDWFKRNVLEEYRIDITVISPVEVPIVGRPRVGARRNPDGSWTVVVGNEQRTVGADEITDILAGMGRRGGPRGAAGPALPPIPSDPSDPIFACPPGEYFDFIALRCMPEVRLPEFPRFELTLPELRLPPRPRLRLTGVEQVTIDHFALNRAAVPRGAEAKLDRLVSPLNAHPDAVVRIEGHTDKSGTEAHNLGLSERRAEAVRAELVRRRVVNPERFRVRGLGETLPLHPEERTPEERVENRRVEVWFVLPAGERAEEFRLRPPRIELPRLTPE